MATQKSLGLDKKIHTKIMTIITRLEVGTQGCAR